MMDSEEPATRPSPEVGQYEDAVDEEEPLDERQLHYHVRD
jgi:hypothetical protein